MCRKGCQCIFQLNSRSGKGWGGGDPGCVKPSGDTAQCSRAGLPPLGEFTGTGLGVVGLLSQHPVPCAPLEFELSTDAAVRQPGLCSPQPRVAVSPCPHVRGSAAWPRALPGGAQLFVPRAPPYAREAFPLPWKPGGGVAPEVRHAASANGEAQAWCAKSRDISARRWPSHHPARPGFFLFRHHARGEWGRSRGRAVSAPSRHHPCSAPAPPAAPGAAGTAPPAWPGLSRGHRPWRRPEPPECGVGAVPPACGPALRSAARRETGAAAGPGPELGWAGQGAELVHCRACGSCGEAGEEVAERGGAGAVGARRGGGPGAGGWRLSPGAGVGSRGVGISVWKSSCATGSAPVPGQRHLWGRCWQRPGSVRRGWQCQVIAAVLGVLRGSFSPASERCCRVSFPKCCICGSCRFWLINEPSSICWFNSTLDLVIAQDWYCAVGF